MQASQRTVFSAPSLVRLLARVSAADIPESGQSPFERLSEWLSWRDAIALSEALDGAVSASAPSTVGLSSTDSASAADARVDAARTVEVRMCADARNALAKAISDDGPFAPIVPVGHASRSARPGSLAGSFAGSGSVAGSSTPPVIEYSVVRQHYLLMQQMMEARISELRERLRNLLATRPHPSADARADGASAGRSAALARLAAIDETMERALGERERSLLAMVPKLLEAHFRRLQKTESDALSSAHDLGDEPSVTPGAWLDVFRKDMQSALHAELVIRFQPIEGLLAALRAR